MNLQQLGFDDFFKEHFDQYNEQGFSAARVAVEHKNMYRVYTEEGDMLAELTGKMRYTAVQREDLPAVGDWVVITPFPDENKAVIHALLPRKSKFSRKVAGDRTEEQIVAANIDTIFLVNALNNDFNLRRMERYLTLVWESGARPVIILNKADLCTDLAEKLSEVESIAMGTPVHTVSCLDGRGFDQLEQYLNPGETIALLGSSGVGKSSIINRLLGEERLQTGEIREDDHKGKHTTTHRELINLPEEGLLIDTPGMREIQLWNSDEGLSGTFEDIEELALGCRFRDCTHQHEPGCAVKQAIDEGRLKEERLVSFHKLQRELKYLEMKQKYKANKAEKLKWNNLMKGK